MVYSHLNKSQISVCVTRISEEQRNPVNSANSIQSPEDADDGTRLESESKVYDELAFFSSIFSRAFLLLVALLNCNGNSVKHIIMPRNISCYSQFCNLKEESLIKMRFQNKNVSRKS